jgi:hypothetical protein
MHDFRFVPRDDMGLITVTMEQRFQLVVRQAGKYGGTGDLVAVQMQNGQHGAIAHGVEEFISMPTRGQRPGLGLAVPDHTGDEQVGVVKCRTIGMCQGIPKLTAFVDGAWNLRRDMARNAPGERKLFEEALHPRFIRRDVGVDFAIGAFKVSVGDEPRSTMPRTGDVDHVQVMRFDDAIEVHVDEVQAWCGAPMPEQAGFDVF